MRVISGSFRGRQLRSLSGERTRPTTGKVREAVFSSIQPIVPASIWLDLFAGSGSIGIEALSRGARFCWFVDNHPPACKTIGANLKSLAISEQHADVLCTDAVAACKKIARDKGRCIDIAYLDPPYASQEIYIKAIKSTELVLIPGGTLIIEHGRQFMPEVRYADYLRTKHYGLSAVSFFRNGGE